MWSGLHTPPKICRGQFIGEYTPKQLYYYQRSYSRFVEAENDKQVANFRTGYLSKSIECTIREEELCSIPVYMPSWLWIRNRLNSEGFQFEDDGLLSSVFNENPKPLGKMIRTYDACRREYLFKQWPNWRVDSDG